VLRPGFEPGDRVGVAIPGYPAYRNILTALDIEPVLIAVGENAHYQPTPELLIDLGKLDGLIVASPANPTGTMIHSVDLARLAEYCRERGIRLISGEIYHGITYETAAATARAYGRGAIIVNSFSKYCSMTGWRLGWMLVPPDLARSVECLAQNFYISPPAFVQENGPERIDLKQDLYRRLDGLLPPDVIIASSSSGLTMSEIQSGCLSHPERCVIGHPFNPPHLVPLVEVVGGAITAPQAIRQAMSFYRSIGKRPVHLRREVVGHVANRLQAALQREIINLIAQGVVDVADVDTVISWGPGLRWGSWGQTCCFTSLEVQAASSMPWNISAPR
jgi:hypothetical protein